MTRRDGPPISSGLVPSCQQLVEAVDWSATPLGPRDRWPRALEAIVRVLLASRHPMFLWWGESLVQIYNDAYAPSFGVGRHPDAMGQRGADCWKDIWPIIHPQIDQVMTQGRPTWNEDDLVPIERNGRVEEVYWTYGYSPVFDDEGRIGGTLVVCTETTNRVVSERRLKLLGTLWSTLLAAGSATAPIAGLLATALQSAAFDIPLALICVDDRVEHAVGLDERAVPAILAVCRPAARAERKVLPHPVATGPWPEPVEAGSARRSSSG
jgi:hypothetical protein